MNNINNPLQNDSVSNQKNSKMAIWEDPTEVKLGSYRLDLKSISIPLILWASLSSSKLPLYDASMYWKNGYAATVSTDIDLNSINFVNKRISAQEARRLALFYMERAEARRRHYVEEMARFQTEREEWGDDR
jgi:hypothetical protein